jgi:hypothetical protein
VPRTSWSLGCSRSGTELIARGQANPAAGFTRNIWVFSAVFTMSAIAWGELLARPGAPARAPSPVGYFGQFCAAVLILRTRLAVPCDRSN